MVIVTINGKDHLLGKYGSKPSRQEYGRLAPLVFPSGDRFYNRCLVRIRLQFLCCRSPSSLGNGLFGLQRCYDLSHAWNALGPGAKKFRPPDLCGTTRGPEG